jgi:hypothetical protein
MRRIIALAASAAAAVAVLAPVAAQADYSTAGQCGSDGNPALGVKTIAIPGVATFYVDDRNYALGNGLWLYQEDNGKANLQRVAGTVAVTSTDKVPQGLGEDSDVCTDLAGAPAGTKGDKLYF